MGEATDRAARLASIRIEAADPRSSPADVAMAQYLAELDERFPNGFDAGQDTPAERAKLTAPQGGFLLVTDRGEPRGCGGVQRLDASTAEIKRMWVHPSLRGLGVGRRLLGELEALAAGLGYRRVQLDTNSSLTQAIAMYEGAGYLPIECYNDNPYAHHWFRKEL